MTKLETLVYEAMAHAPKAPKDKYNGKTILAPVAATEERKPHVVPVMNIQELKTAVGTLLVAKEAVDAEYEWAAGQIVHEGQHRFAAENQLAIADVGHELAIYHRGVGPFRQYTYHMRTVLPHGAPEPEVLYIAAFPEILSTDDKRAMEIGNVGIAAIADYAAAHDLRSPMSANRQ